MFVLGLIILMCRATKKHWPFFLICYGDGKYDKTHESCVFLVSFSVEPQLDDANDDAYAVYTAIRMDVSSDE